MGFFVKHKLRKLFRKSFKEIKKLYTYQSPGAWADTEIYASLYVIFDFFAFLHNKREIVATAIAPLYIDLTNDTHEYVISRLEFYNEFLRHKQPRCDFAPNEKEEVKNPISRVSMALTDIISNPDLLNDYDTSPMQLCGLAEGFICTAAAMAIVSISQKIDSEMQSIFPKK